MTLPPQEVARRLDQQAHDIEDAYGLLTELRAETAAGFARVDGRLDNVDGRLDRLESHLGNVESHLGNVESHLGNVKGHLANVDGRLDSQGRLLERILGLLENPGN